MPKHNPTQQDVLSMAIPFGIGNSRDVPLPFEEAISEVPTGQKVDAIPPRLKLTTGSIQKAIKRGAILLQHDLNLPHTDGLRSVSAIFKVVEAAAFNYQRTHQDAFFEAYPELCIMKTSDSATTHYLRMHYRDFARRIAHWWWEYSEAKKMQLGALTNLMILTRLNGTETAKNIASDVKWGRINTTCVLYERSPVPIGLEAYVSDHSKYGFGKSTFGADLVSIPLWITDVFGNRFTKAIPPDNLIKTNSAGDAKSAGINYDAGAQTVEETLGLVENATELAKNIQEVVEKFGHRNALSETAFKSFSTMPIIENGGASVLDGNQGVDHYTALLHDNYGGDNYTTTPGKFGVTSDLTKRLWSMFDMWTSHLLSAFPEMFDPNNDRYTYAVEQLHLFEPSSKLETYFNSVRNQYNYTMESLAKSMVYKASNHANTATIVKFAPALYNSSDVRDYFTTDAMITKNLERFDVLASSPADVIKSGKAWPHLNPTLFTYVVQDPYTQICLNSVGMVGQEIMPAAAIANGRTRYVTPTGKYASMLDIAVSNSVAPDISRIEGFGVTTDIFGKYIEDGNSIVYEEDPSCSWVMTMPLFNTSDLSQCGFKLLISDDDQVPNEWERFFTDIANYADSNALTNAVEAGVVEIDGDKYPLTPAFGQLQTDAQSRDYFDRAHVVNPKYRQLKRHMFIFIGAGCFNHPLMVLGRKTAGFYINRIQDDSSDALYDLALAFGHDDTTSFPWWDNTAKSNDNAYVDLSPADSDIIHNYIVQNFIISLQAGQSMLSIDKFIFSPDYGPVMPCTMQPSIPDENELIPQPGSSFVAEFSHSPFYAKNTYFDPSTGGSLGVSVGEVAEITRQSGYDIAMSPAEWLIYFLASVKYPKCLPDGFGGYEVSTQNNAVEIDFSTINKWMYTLTSSVVAQFVGMHDSYPYWSNIDMRPSAPDLATTDKFPENNIIAQPRAVQYKQNSKDSSVKVGRPHGKTRSETDNAADFFKGETPKEGNKESGNRRFRRNRKGKKPEVNSDAVDYLKVKSEMATFGSQGANSDSSTTSEDKDFSKKKKLPVNAESIIN